MVRRNGGIAPEASGRCRNSHGLADSKVDFSEYGVPYFHGIGPKSHCRFSCRSLHFESSSQKYLWIAGESVW
jgi:hypothetical protein